MNELWRLGPRALHIIIITIIVTDVQSRWPRERVKLRVTIPTYIILNSHCGPCYFFSWPRGYIYLPNIITERRFRLLRNVVPSRAPPPPTPRARADEKKLHQNRIHTTFSAWIGLWFVTAAAAAAVRILYIIIII